MLLIYESGGLAVFVY